MLDFGWTELLVIAVVAIVVVGPKDLPRALRTVGQWTGKMKRMAREFQGQFNEALREAELDSVKREVQEIGKIDPVGDMRKEMAKVEAGIKKDMDVKLPADGKGVGAKPAEAEAAKAEPAKVAAAASKPEVVAEAKPAEAPRAPAKRVAPAKPNAAKPRAPAKAKAAAKPKAPAKPKTKAKKPAPVADPAPAAGAKS